MRNAGVVLDHSTIYDRIWHYDFGPDSKNLAVYIGYLRRKTEDGGGDRLIHTVRGVGYVASGGAVSLRWKIALALAGADVRGERSRSALAVYRVTKDRLLTEIDRSLAERQPAARARSVRARPRRRSRPAARLRGAAGAGGRDGGRDDVRRARGSDLADAGGVGRRAAGRQPPSTRSRSTATTIGSARSGIPRGAFQVARSLDETERILRAAGAHDRVGR